MNTIRRTILTTMMIFAASALVTFAILANEYRDVQAEARDLEAIQQARTDDRLEAWAQENDWARWPKIQPSRP